MRISKRQIMIYMATNGQRIKTLAEKIGIQANNLSTILTRGTCRPDTAAKIADGLGVTIVDIIEEES